MTFRTIVENILGIVNNALIPLIFGFAFIYFIYGIARYFIFAQGDVDARKTGVAFLVWGIFGLFIMVSFWGIVSLLLQTFHL